MRIATIARDPENSPNMVSNDMAILERVAKELTELGHEVITVDETGDIPGVTDIVCHMSRNPEILQKLRIAENNGTKVTNPPEAVCNCSRIEFMSILEKSGIPQPLFRIIEKAEDFCRLPFPAWIKRGNGWSCHKDDVCYAIDSHEAIEIFDRMRQRGVNNVVYTRHCEGDIMKFYGVGDRFFTYSYPAADKTKFGLEKINGEPRHYQFDAEALHRMVTKAANAIGLEIYGGDCIIDSGGNIMLIDINDFPSFSSVREEAAKAIAGYVTESKKRK